MAQATMGFSHRFIVGTWATVLILGLGLVCLFAMGCSSKGSKTQAAKKPPLVAKVTVDYESASPEEVDATIFPILQRNAPTISHTRTITCISRSGSFEAYVQGGPDANATELENQLTSALPAGDLPSGASGPTVCFVKTGVPVVTPKAVPVIDFELNRGKLGTLGLNIADVQKQVSHAIDQHPADGNAAEALRTMTVENAHGQHVPLSSIGAVKMTNRPDCIVRIIPHP